jgi:hypothetical protein
MDERMKNERGMKQKGNEEVEEGRSDRKQERKQK